MKRLQNPIFLSVLFFFLLINILYAQAPDTLWTKTYSGTPPTSTDYGRCVRQTDDGEFIVAGYNTWYGDAGIWLLKTNVNGDTTWTIRRVGREANAVQQTKDKGYIVIGYVLLKTDSSGNISWEKGFGDAD